MQTKWKIVPVEPTEKMAIAGEDIQQQPFAESAIRIYRVMIAVSPPCEDLETVKAALLYYKTNYEDGLEDKTPEENRATNALAALGRIRGE